MIRRILFAAAWLPTTIAFLVFCLYVLSLQKRPLIRTPQAFGDSIENKFKFYAALPAVLGSQNSSVVAGDARPFILEKFIKKYNPQSPLLPYTHYFVDSADRYNLAFSLMVAIAMQESNLCKSIPEESKNCWGLGIYGAKVWRFDNYEDAIENVAKTLSKYATKGRLQPEEIMQLYTPSSDGSWSFAVRKFMDEMQ